MEYSKETATGENLENCKNAWMFAAQLVGEWEIQAGELQNFRSFR